MSADTRTLVKRAQKGDGDAFAELYSYYKTDLYRFASYMLNNRDDAEDAVMEAVMSSYRSINTLRDPDSFKSWLFKILSNECKRTMKQNGHFPDTLPDEQLFFSLRDEGLPDVQLGLELQEAINSLPPPDGQIVLMSVIGGFKSHELSFIFGMPSSTVRSKLARSLDKLQTIIGG